MEFRAVVYQGDVIVMFDKENMTKADCWKKANKPVDVLDYLVNHQNEYVASIEHDFSSYLEAEDYFNKHYIHK